MQSQGIQGEELDQTTADALSRELHNTAQPLTVLQGSLEYMLERISTGDASGTPLGHADAKTSRLASYDECKGLLKRAGEEVQRLTNCFENVRTLIGLQRPAGDIGSFSLPPMVTSLLQNLSADLDAADITVVFDAAPSGDPMSVFVNASISRVLAGIRLVLTTVVSCLCPGDQIRISIETDGSNAEIRFRPSRHSCPFASHDLLLSKLTSQLQFAKILFATVGGELRLSKAPDIVVLSLPSVASQPAG